MQYRTLGRDPSYRVSAIALGTMSVAPGPMHAAMEECRAAETVAAALDCGINFFDTAPGYGDGESERRLGKALRASGRPRDAYVVATKAGGATLSRDEVVADCEASLQRLGLDHVDLYQVHWLKRAVPLEETLRAMDDLRRAGKVRLIGMCNVGPLDTAESMRHVPLASVQVVYSLLSRAAEFGLQQLCAEKGVGLLCYSPMAQGLLTGRYKTIDEVPPERLRSRHFHKSRPMSRHGEEGCERETFEAIAAVSRIAREAGLSMPDLSMAWLLRQPAVTSVLAGASTAEQARENARAAEVTLSDDVVRALDEATRVLKERMGPNLDMWQGAGNSRVR